LFIATQQLRSRNGGTAQLPSRGQLDQQPGVDGSKFSIEAPIVAAQYDVTVKHPKLATWRLMAPGRARIVENKPDHVTIALESGLIEADVIPQPKPESFAIEVARTRVAVHGTIFSVERRGELAEVVVREGKVMVSQGNHGRVQKTLLTAPSRAQLDLEPKNDSDFTHTSEPREPALASSGRHATERMAPSNPLGVTPPERPSAEELDRVWSRVSDVVSGCFTEHTAKTPSVRVLFKTNLTVNLGVSGAVAQVDFNPPVPEPVRTCTLTRVSNINTTATLRGAVVTRPTVLAR
jgi:hypothetical protein